MTCTHCGGLMMDDRWDEGQTCTACGRSSFTPSAETLAAKPRNVRVGPNLSITAPSSRKLSGRAAYNQ